MGRMHRDYLRRLPKEIKELVRLARGISAAGRMPSYLVGGIVRDLILGVENFDVDIVVEKDGVKFARDLATKLKGKIICHNRFGTATLTSCGSIKIDIATARKEAYPAAAHLPVVSPGTIRDDLYRRDFTINAMAIGISLGIFGKLTDLFGGLSDLKGKKVRVLHEASFIDDPTRILRAIRFEQRYNFKIETNSLQLLKEAVESGALEKVHPHRLRDELVLILKEERPLKHLKRMRQLSGFRFMHSRLVLSKKKLALLASAEKEISSFRKKYPCRRAVDSWLVYLIILLEGFKPEELKKICRTFGFRKGEEKRILSHNVIGRGFLDTLKNKKLSPSKLFALLEPLSYEVILLIKAKHKERVMQRHLADFFKIYNGMRLCVGGDDLRALGLKPGPHYQMMFSRALKAKLHGRVKTKEEEIKLIKKIAGIK